MNVPENRVTNSPNDNFDGQNIWECDDSAVNLGLPDSQTVTCVYVHVEHFKFLNTEAGENRRGFPVESS